MKEDLVSIPELPVFAPESATREVMASEGWHDFLWESNQIEGIERGPSVDEIVAFAKFMQLFSVSATALGDLQAVFAPGKPIREREGMNVRVGRYVAPPGGPNIVRRLQAICREANSGADPWKTHVRFEKLHPYMDGNGRTGRMLWAWMMYVQGKQPFALSFLHRFYYQTLEAQQ